MDILLAEGRTDRAAGIGSYGAGVDRDGPRLGSLHDTLRPNEDFLGHAGVADTGEQAIGFFSHLARAFASHPFFLGGKLLRFQTVMRPKRHFMSGSQQIAGHGITH
jgi:hypothetical protein